MLVDFDGLAQHFEETVPTHVRAVYLAFSHCRLPDGWIIRPAGHGYISRELRFERDQRWYYAAVLNKSWVLFYFRHTCFSDQVQSWDKVRSDFPEATMAQENNLTIRVGSSDLALRVVEYICH